MLFPCSGTMEVKSLMTWFTSSKLLCGNRMEPSQEQRLQVQTLVSRECRVNREPNGL
jgi:hypothetical protein